MKKISLPVSAAHRQHPFMEWLKVTRFLYGWAAREHHLNLQALGLVPLDSRERDARSTKRASHVR